jgi:MYXO-CTERM domain-containing protein
VALAAFCLATSASAVVLQPTPGGIPVPKTSGTKCENGAVGVCLDDHEGNPDYIDAVQDALVAPEVFEPTCTLTFKPVVTFGKIKIAFGWYNVTDKQPALDALYAMVVLPGQFMTIEQLVPYTRTLSLSQEKEKGRYKGGKIGFFLAVSGTFGIDEQTGLLTGTPQKVFYTEHKYNPGSGTEKTYYQVLTWQSVAYKNAFYFGWEDLAASATSDNDFDDVVFLVSGIQCSGGGQPCPTGKLGICADGTMMCQKDELICVQNVEPTAEKCDALDNDCNGEVDEGELCPVGQICVRGSCVPHCGTGEFRCAGNEVCTVEGVCMDAACAKVECPAGKVCLAGECVDACTGVVCPHGRLCRNGGCVDPCTSIVCDEGFSCVLGVCESCECTPCPEGTVCNASLVCIEPACETLSCDAGTHCVDGSCIDNCAGAVCPRGQTCATGECVGDGSGSGSGPGEGGSGGDAVIEPIIDPLGDAAAPQDGTSAANGDLGSRTSAEQAACACRVGPAERTSTWLAVLLGLGLLAGLRRRR